MNIEKYISKMVNKAQVAADKAEAAAENAQEATKQNENLYVENRSADGERASWYILAGYAVAAGIFGAAYCCKKAKEVPDELKVYSK